MNMNRKALRITACCVAAAITLSGAPALTYGAAPVAGVSGITAAASSQETQSTPQDTANAAPVAGASGLTAAATEQGTEVSQDADPTEQQDTQADDSSAAAGPSAGISSAVANAVNTAEESAQNTASSEVTQNIEPEVKSEYADIAVAQVENCVNIRDAASEEGNVVGKLYNNSAATVVATEGDWYQITSGNVTGYVKSEYVVCGDEELAKSVGRRVAKVNTETLRVRTEPSTDASILELVPDQEELTVTDESMDGWIKASVEAGEGFVSTEFVELSTQYETAESKEEEEARLAKEEAEREAANAAASKKTTPASGSKKSASAPSSSGGSAVASYAGQFVGNPYVYGGTSLTNGADCSGFVLSVYAAFGVGLPHSSAAMQGVGYGVSPGEMQPGDIICYSGHVAIYVGNNTIVHASTPETGIKYTSPADYKQILAVRRIF